MELQSNIANDNYLFEKRFEMMIDTNNKRVTNELNSIKNMISKLNEELCELKKKINENPIQRKEILQNENYDNTNNDLKIKKNEPLKNENYKSEDVSIEKFFYFGNKAR